MTLARTCPRLLLLLLTVTGACATGGPGPPSDLGVSEKLAWWIEAAISGDSEREGDLKNTDVDRAAARRGLRDLALEAPRDPLVLTAGGLLALMDGDAPSAERWLDDALARRQGDPRAAAARAGLMARQGDLDGARLLLESAVLIHPDDAGLHEAIAGVAYLDEDLQTAAASLDRAERLGGETSRTWYHRGLLAEHSGDRAAARQAFERAVSLDPSNTAAARRARTTSL